MKDLDTFFCSGDFSAFSAAFPTADTADFFLLQGENEWAKQALFSAICKIAVEEKIPFVRVLHADSAAKTVAVYLPQAHRFAADADYFATLCNKYETAKRYSVPVFEYLSPDGETSYGVCRKAAEEATARATAFLRAAASARKKSAETLAANADRAKILRAVLEFVDAVAPYAQAKRGKVLFRRNLSAVTAWGIHTVYNPFRQGNLRTAVLRDVYGGISPLFLQGLSTACTEIGIDVCLYTEPLSETPAHLVLPACNLAFFTENDLHPFPFRACGELGASRFIKRSAARAVLPDLKNLHAEADDALECASFSLYEADEAQSVLRRIEENATDRTALSTVQECLLRDFFDFRHFAEKENNFR